MYQSTPELLQALNRPVQTHSLRGRCDGVSFTGKDVLADTFRVSNRMSEATSVKLGGVYIGQLQLTFSNRFASERGSWFGKKITAEVGIKTTEGVEWIPVGVYTVNDATWTQEGLQIIAYDNMSKFDKTISMDQSSGSAYSFFNFACATCKVEFGMTESEVRKLPNGGELFGMYPLDSVKTWRDMISWLAQALCSFATIDREGKLVIKPFPITSEAIATVNTNHRYSGASFSDYETYYTSISIVDIATSETKRYGYIEGLEMPLGSNPFLQYGMQSVKDGMLNSILSRIRKFRFTPFGTSTLLNPLYDLGDVIKFEGGIAQNSLGVVMSYSMDLNTVVINGFGENPALLNAMSDAEKEASGASSTANRKSVVYYTHVNVDDINIGANEKEVANIHYLTTETTTVNLWSEFKLNVALTSDKAVLTFRYYADGELIDYSPVHTISEDGFHVVNLLYYLLDVEGNRDHIWRVTLEMSGGTATILAGDEHTLLSGQGLVDDPSFDNVISFSEVVSIPYKGNFGINAAEGEIGVSVEKTNVFAFEEDHRIIYGSGTSLYFVNAHDELAVISKQNAYELITEDRQSVLVTEEGGTLTTEGDFV